MARACMVGALRRRGFPVGDPRSVAVLSNSGWGGGGWVGGRGRRDGEGRLCRPGKEGCTQRMHGGMPAADEVGGHAEAAAPASHPPA